MASAKNLKFPDKETGKVVVATATRAIKESESGTTFVWNATAGFNFDLPKVRATNKGIFFDFVIRTASTTGVGHGVSPKSDDLVQGGSLVGADNKDVYFAIGAGNAINNGFRAISDGKDGWQLKFVVGTAVREA